MLDLTVPCANPACHIRFEKRDVRQRYCSDQCAGKTVSPFIAVDGEGVGKGKNHQYVLLGVGQEQREWPDGVQNITEVFEFLYSMYEKNAIYTGFYLGYDWNMWLKLLPRERAWMLLSREGQHRRKRKSEQGARLGPFPVSYRDWEFDLLAGKRFRLRPENAGEWMYINDSGPFFQTSLMAAIDPRKWNDPVVTRDEYEILKIGKERRSSAVLDDDMRFYNRLENDILSRLMDRYRDGLGKAGVTLNKKQWFGPGQAAQKWLRVVGTLDRITESVRDRAKRDRAWWDAACSTYYGGWFELMAHGHLPGITYEYDINSAYPYIAANLPCVCGNWRHGTGTPARSDVPRMVRIVSRGIDKNIGGLPYRTQDNHVLRPRYTEGWYWYHEVQAAKRAGLISDVIYLEWYDYLGCNHEPPLKLLKELYKNRLAIGKDTPTGKAFKLIYNSVYGKLCQSAGEDTPFSNPVYASLITAGTRTMILDAIAAHPDKSDAVVMVATDGVYFRSPHPGLILSESLGNWSIGQHVNLTLFKPGIYWSDKTRQEIADGEKPQFKARGINAEDFGRALGDVDTMFSAWEEAWIPGMPPGKDDWPTVSFKAHFSQTSVKQAVQWTDEIKDPAKQQAVYKSLAGRVTEDKKLTQDSYPGEKRNPASVELRDGIWRSQPWDGGVHLGPSKPYDKNFGMRDELGGFDGFVTPDSPVMVAFRGVVSI